MIYRNEGGTEVVDVRALSAAEFKNQASFTGWDFKKVWKMGENAPKLRTGYDVITYDENWAGGAKTKKELADGDGILANAPADPKREGWHFCGWFTESEGGVKVTGETVADGDATYYAQWGKPVATFAAGAAMPSPSDGSPAITTNVWCGVYLEWPLASEALSQTTVKVAGLPSGLKFTAKDIMKKGSKTEVEIPANTIYGAPTAASKADRNGNPTPSAVKITVTTAGKSSQTYQIDTVVEALPAWAVGTFAGGVFSRTGGDDGRDGARPFQGEENAQAARSTNGVVSLTIDAKGKMSGKALGEGLTYTLAAPYYSSFGMADGVSNFIADVTASWSYKEGTKTVKTNDVVQLVVQDNGIGGVATGGPLFSSAAQPESAPYHLMAWQYNWKVEPWKTLGKSFDKKTMTYAILADGSFSDAEDVLTSALGADVTARVTLKFAASGAVSVAGEFAMYDKNKAKYTTVKATGSATLVPVDDEHGEVFIYLTPKGLPPHARCLNVPWPEE